MTDEEKKEFEEFLQWKAERAKRNELKKEPDISDSSEMTDNNSSEVSVSNDSEKSKAIESKNDNGNAGIIILCLFAALIILGLIVFGSSSNSGTLVAEDSVTNLSELSELSQPIVDEKHDSIAHAERISAVKKTIKIKSAYLSSPNSASGVDAYFYYKNVSDKTIKYLVWIGYPMNAVGDRVDCEIRGYADYRGKDTGPIKPGKSSGGCWSCAWYNWTAKKLILTGIEIEYMDGTTFTIYEDEIDYIR